MPVGKHTAALLLLIAASPAAAQVNYVRSSPDTPDPLAGPRLSDPLADLQGNPPTPLSALPPPEGDDRYRPEVGQAGKDVIWIPTPPGLVKAMLSTAGVGPRDYVVDLGSGDGRIAIAAARDFGARAMGIEYNSDMVSLAQRNALKAGVADRATFRQGDIFRTDFSNATVVTMYLLPSINLKLRDTLLKMRPGTRIVSHAFSMGEWQPEQTISADSATGYFWIVPAQVGGRWAFEVGGRRFTTSFSQSFQKLFFDSDEPFREGRLKGRFIALTRADGSQLVGEVLGDEMSGRGWSASRIRSDN